MLNFASVCGIGAFTWVEKDRANETVFINGIDDRITLTTKGTSRELPTLQIESLAEFNDAQYGFIFYVTYYPRGNVDPLKPNRVNEILWHYITPESCHRANNVTVVLVVVVGVTRAGEVDVPAVVAVVL